MSAETEQFQALWAEKVAAHDRCREARQAGDTKAHDKHHAEMIAKGDEAMALAEAFVEANRTTLDTFLYTKTLEDLVRLIDAYRKVGDEEQATIATMYEMAKFDRQHIGGGMTVAIKQSFLGSRNGN